MLLLDPVHKATKQQLSSGDSQKHLLLLLLGGGAGLCSDFPLNCLLCFSSSPLPICSSLFLSHIQADSATGTEWEGVTGSFSLSGSWRGFGVWLCGWVTEGKKKESTHLGKTKKGKENSGLISFLFSSLLSVCFSLHSSWSALENGPSSLHALLFYS